MKTNIKLFIKVVIINLIMITSMYATVYASPKNEQVISDNKILEDVSNSEKIALNNYNENQTYLIEGKTKNILEELNINFQQVNKIELIQKDKNELYRIECDESIIEIDAHNNQLVSIINLKDTDLPGKYKSKQSYCIDEKVSLSRIPKTFNENLIKTSSDLTLTNIISKIESLFQISSDYKLVYNKEFDEDLWELSWQKEIYSNVFNKYDGFKAIVNRKDGSLEAFNRFNEPITYNNPLVSSEQAISIGKGIIKEHGLEDNTYTKAVLTVAKPNRFWETGSLEYLDIPKLAWKVTFSYGDSYVEVYVDSFNNQIIGGDHSKSSEGFGAFTIPTFVYNRESNNNAQNGLKKLGYNDINYAYGNPSKGTLNNFFGRNDAYAVYISSHGGLNPTRLHNNTSNNYWTLYPSDISGNWHLVILDACTTADTTEWADAFKVRGYSRRAYLGWYGTVEVGNAYNFYKNFWELVGSMPIQKAAVQAASSVPGSGTTPIRFYGDKSYYGWAW